LVDREITPVGAMPKSQGRVSVYRVSMGGLDSPIQSGWQALTSVRALAASCKRMSLWKDGFLSWLWLSFG